MDSSSAQEMGSQTLESILVGRNVKTVEQEKKGGAGEALKCPRCDSINTKFCYYNNYSLSQPRYFCKSCRRYWTKGGTLRNVPVGGGCRKNKRSSSSKRDQPLPNPNIPYDSNNLIASLQKQQSNNQFGDHDFSIWGNPNMHNSGHGLFDALRTGFVETPAQNLYYGMASRNLELEGMGMGMNGGGQGMGIPFQDFSGGATTTTAVTTVKQEMCGGREGESRVLWGFPWQNAGAASSAAEFDSGRVNWNGIGSSNWQGLLNSPLM